MSNLTSHWDTILQLCPMNSFKLPVQVYFYVGYSSNCDNCIVKGAYFPHSWEDINLQINFSQMLHSARIYQLPGTNVLCCFQTQDQDQDSLLVKRRNNNPSPGPVYRELVPSSHQRSELSNTILSSSADEIRESGRAFQSLIVWGKKLPL